MVEGFRLLCEIFSEEPVASLIEYSFVANMMMGIPPSGLTGAMLRDDPGAWLIRRVGSLAMVWVPAIRRHFLVAGGRGITSILGDPQSLATYRESGVRGKRLWVSVVLWGGCLR